MACQINEDCLREVAAVIGGVGIASQVIDKIKNNVELFCGGKFDKDDILTEAANELVPKAQAAIDGIVNNIKPCFARTKFPPGTWKSYVKGFCAGGRGGMANIIKSLLAPFYDDGIIATVCGPNGVSAIGDCVNLFEPACLAPLAPWTTGKCLTAAGFTEGNIFKPTDEGGDLYTIPTDMREDVYAACYGLNLEWEITTDENLPCRGEIDWTLRINGLDGLLGILDEGREVFNSNEEANKAIIKIANKVKAQAKKILRKAYSLVFAELNIAYNNQLKFLRGLSGAIKDDTVNVIGPVVDAILSFVKGTCGSIPCIDDAIANWRSVGAGANTDDCWEKLRRTLIPFDPKKAPTGRHHVCLVAGSADQWPSVGGVGSQGMPMPPAKGNPAWEDYVRQITQNQNGVNNPDYPQCGSATIIDWAWDGNCINITYRFNPVAAWAYNTTEAKALCNDGHIDTITKAMENLVKALNATRGPCGRSPIYASLVQLIPFLGDQQYIGFNEKTCTYVAPGPGIVDNPDRGGDWPPAGQPGAIGVGVPLPDDCKYYPAPPGTKDRNDMGLKLLVLKKILNRINPSINWGKAKEELEAFIKEREALIDEACS